MKKTLGIVVLLLAVLAGAPAAQSPSSVKAFTGMRLWDGSDRAPIDNGAIVVRDGRIVAAGAAAAVTIPAGAERVDLSGKFVVPGLVNAHGHLNNVDRDLATYAAYGITTVYSLGNDTNPEVFVVARDAQNTPALNHARIFTVGPVLAPTTPDEARDMVARNAAMHVDMIKIRVDPGNNPAARMKPDVYRAVIDEAHKRGLRVAVHIVWLEDAQGVMDAGADFLAHSVRDADVTPKLIADLKSRNVCLSPTLMREVTTFVYESTPEFFADPLFLAHADPKVVEQLKEPARQDAMRTSAGAKSGKVMLDFANRNLKTLEDAGVRIAMGTDTGAAPNRFQGYFELMELEMMVKAGLTPKQALLSATRDAAGCMQIDQNVGTIAEGKWADLVALNADPLADIKNIRAIDSVWIAGNRVPR